MNKQFKVGDAVVRINYDNGGHARIGQLAHVAALDGDGSPFVEYEGRDERDERGEPWYHANAQLVPGQACRFVPGTTYKDREGREYRFVAYVEAATCGIFLTQCNSAVLRQADGKLLNNPLREILPNKATRTICVYRTGEGRLVAVVAALGTTVRPTRGPTWTLIGKVEEEVEVY